MTPLGRVATGGGGALLLISLFLPWASEDSYEANGWELGTPLDIFLLLVGIAGIAAAFTGGRHGLFRPDVSLIGAADLFGVIASVVVAWLLLFDFPDGVGTEIGIYLALAGAIAQACGAADWGAPARGDMFAPTGQPAAPDVRSAPPPGPGGV